MKKLIYTCDQCDKEFGDKEHFSFHFQNDSGVGRSAYPHLQRFTNSERYLQFCNGQCVGRYFSKYMKEYKS